jgi:hypothetical protein
MNKNIWGQRYTLVINHMHYVDTVCVHFSPESVVINGFFSKTGAWEDAEQLQTQLDAFTLVTDKFCQLPVLFIE